ncbi:hypothetical protein L208DRAFT_1325680 [Tricholoma matsutake]|nr:hypothetical protein L208DRAFT_1325680 [Tricholoma matsutake 945]
MNLDVIRKRSRHSLAPGHQTSQSNLLHYNNSSPTLAYRTGTTPWTMPKACRQLKEHRPIFHHKINIIWEELGPKVCQLLENKGLFWTSIDVICFKVGEGPVSPVVLWIGVIPKMLSVTMPAPL